MGLLLSELELGELGVDEHSHDRAVLLDSVHILHHGLHALVVFLPLLSVLREGLLLGEVPVLIESSLQLGGQVLSEDSGELSESAGGLDVSYESHNLEGRALNDGDRLNNVLLDELFTLSVLVVTRNMGHTGLVAYKGGEVDGTLGVVPGEGSDAASVMSGSAAGEESQRAVSGCFEFSMGHISYLIIISSNTKALYIS